MVTMLATPLKVSIYDDGAGDAPFNDPLSYLGLIKFDSTFRYLPFLPARTIAATVSIPASLGSDRFRIITLGPHGQPGVPFINGYYLYGGVTGPTAWAYQPLLGTNLIFGPGTNGTMVTWTLGVDGTNVFIAEERSRDSQTLSSSRTIDVVVFISSTLAG